MDEKEASKKLLIEAKKSIELGEIKKFLNKASKAECSKFKQTEYTLIEYEDESEFIIGTVLLYKGKVCNAKICEDEIGNPTDLKKVQQFLKEVEQLDWIRKTDSLVG